VIGSAPVGALDADLCRACLEALKIPARNCIAFAARHDWATSAEAFVRNIARASHPGDPEANPPPVEVMRAPRL
jgi:hypothetical protein